MVESLLREHPGEYGSRRNLLPLAFFCPFAPWVVGFVLVFALGHGSEVLGILLIFGGTLAGILLSILGLANPGPGGRSVAIFALALNVTVPGLIAVAFFPVDPLIRRALWDGVVVLSFVGALYWLNR